MFDLKYFVGQFKNPFKNPLRADFLYDILNKNRSSFKKRKKIVIKKSFVVNIPLSRKHVALKRAKFFG